MNRVRLLCAALLLSAALPTLAAKRPLGPGERIDVNRAGIADLMRLPGVGERRAQAIVALRQKGPFRRPEDLLAVKGLGPAWFSRVKGLVTVGGLPATAPAASPAPTPRAKK